MNPLHEKSKSNSKSRNSHKNSLSLNTTREAIKVTAATAKAKLEFQKKKMSNIISFITHGNVIVNLSRKHAGILEIGNNNQPLNTDVYLITLSDVGESVFLTPEEQTLLNNKIEEYSMIGNLLEIIPGKSISYLEEMIQSLKLINIKYYEKKIPEIEFTLDDSKKKIAKFQKETYKEAMSFFESELELKPEIERMKQLNKLMTTLLMDENNLQSYIKKNLEKERDLLKKKTDDTFRDLTLKYDQNKLEMEYSDEFLKDHRRIETIIKKLQDMKHYKSTEPKGKKKLVYEKLFEEYSKLNYVINEKRDYIKSSMRHYTAEFPNIIECYDNIVNYQKYENKIEETKKYAALVPDFYKCIFYPRGSTIGKIFSNSSDGQKVDMFANEINIYKPKSTNILPILYPKKSDIITGTFESIINVVSIKYKGPMFVFDFTCNGINTGSDPLMAMSVFANQLSRLPKKHNKLKKEIGNMKPTTTQNNFKIGSDSRTNTRRKIRSLEPLPTEEFKRRQRGHIKNPRKHAWLNGILVGNQYKQTESDNNYTTRIQKEQAQILAMEQEEERVRLEEERVRLEEEQERVKTNYKKMLEREQLEKERKSTPISISVDL